MNNPVKTYQVVIEFAIDATDDDLTRLLDQIQGIVENAGDLPGLEDGSLFAAEAKVIA